MLNTDCVRFPYSVFRILISAFSGPGDDLLSRVLRQSTIGAEAFDGRVRDGIGSYRLAKATRPAKGRAENGRRTTEDGQRRTDQDPPTVVRPMSSAMKQN